MSRSVPESNKEWEVRSAADTLMQAEKIRLDKKLFGKAKQELKHRQEEVANVLQVNGEGHKPPQKHSHKNTNDGSLFNF